MQNGTVTGHLQEKQNEMPWSWFIENQRASIFIGVAIICAIILVYAAVQAVKDDRQEESTT